MKGAIVAETSLACGLAARTTQARGMLALAQVDVSISEALRQVQ
jgi:hypothetical protein